MHWLLSTTNLTTLAPKEILLCLTPNIFLYCDNYFRATVGFYQLDSDELAMLMTSFCLHCTTAVYMEINQRDNT